MSSRRHRKGRIGADSLYKQEFLSYIVFSCLPVGTGRVMSSRIGAKINVIELEWCYFVGKWEYDRGCR